MGGKNKRAAMGKGLGALMGANAISVINRPEADSEQIAQKEQLQDVVAGKMEVVEAIAAIDIELIELNPYQPRRVFEEDKLQELSDSIKEHGVIQPLTVCRNGEKYQLISGERRLRASKMAGLERVPVYIISISENQKLEIGLVENIQREDLNAMDIALSYRAMAEKFSYTQEQISQKVGKDRSTVANYLRLVNLPASIQLALSENKISMGHAKALLSLESAEKQADLLNKIVEKELSVKEVEKLVSSERPRKTKTPSVELPDWYAPLRDGLSSKLDGILVDVKPMREGKGKLQLNYSSQEELKAILEKLNS